MKADLELSYFEEQLNCDDATKELQQLIASISGWLSSNGFHNNKVQERFESIETMLGEKQRHVLFLAEFSRGKTELINSTIFGSMGRRFLPSTPGRTTRCTTVLQYDPEELPSIKLLPTLGPVEVQRQPISLLQQNPEHWHRTLFAPSDEESVIKSLKQIAEVELVTPDIAKELGFIKSIGNDTLAKIDIIDGKIAIPKYRHAIVNFPHPLLKQGLSIIDTPGLNALGIEPELTLRSLEMAHAIVFVLSMDTGITRSELEAWNEHVKNGPTENIMVVINKIDTLWDQLNSQTEIDFQIKKQVAEVARILNIPSSRIFPVSAQKSLLARKENDYSLTNASGINLYEQALADTINLTNRRSIVNRCRAEIVSILDVVLRVVGQRFDATKAQIANIEKQKKSQSKASDDNIQKVRKERVQLEEVAQELSLFRVNMKIDYENFIKRLDLYALDKLIARYRFEISNQLTTTGLQREMNDFQSQSVEKFTDALNQISILESKLVNLYKKVEGIMETKGLKPRPIHPTVYMDALKVLNDKHDKYAKGITLVMTEQNALSDRYHASVMVKIRKLYLQTRDEFELWCRTVLVPLELELKEKGSQLKKRLLSLERVRTSGPGLKDEIRVLQSRLEGHDQRKKTIKHFVRRLDELAEDDKPGINNVIDLRSRSLAG